MPKGLPNDLGKWMAQVEKRLDNLSSGNRLDHASLDGTTLYLKGDGQLGRIGRQPDGSNGVHVVKVQPPPQLTAAILTVGEQAGTCLVEWDGNTFDGRRMPLIHGHTEIWAELVDADWSPTVAPGDTAKRVGSIRDRTGGEVVVALPQAGTWAVWLRAMGADRETAGPWSPVSQVDISPLVDTDAIEAELEDARARLAVAEAEAREALDEAGRVKADWDEHFPALQQELQDAQQAVQDAEHRLAVAEQNVTDASAGVDNLREVRIPALQDALTTGLGDVYRDAQAYAEAQADNAVNRAAADAQTEYDRLQELAERALSRAGDNVLEDPSFETDYWVDRWDGINGLEVFRHATSPRTGDWQLRIRGDYSADLPFESVDVELGQSYRMGIYWATLSYTGSQAFLVFKDTDTGDDLAVSEPMLTSGYHSRLHVMLEVPEGTESITPVLRVEHVTSSSTSTLIVDDASLREVGAAAEALRAAEQARHEAQQAHELAGGALDAAANAYDAASAKNTIHWSLSAPSGTADSTDDVWWQYELRNGRRVVVGQWFWGDGVWRETEIAEEWLPLVNVGTGTYGTFTGDRLEAHSVRTNHLLVGPRNIITDPEFEALGVGSVSDGWDNFNGGWEKTSTSWGTPYRGFARIADASDTSNSTLHYGGSGPGNASLPCVPGESYKLRFQVVRYVGWSVDDDYRARFRWADADGNGVAWTSSNFASVGNQGWHEVEATAPEGAAWFYVQFYKSGAVGGARGVGNVSLEKMTDSSLIVRGAVNADKIVANEVAAAVAEFLELHADQITAGTIDADRLNVSDLAARLATIITLNADAITTGELGAERINTASLFTEDGFINNLTSSVVTALQVTAERGFIGGALLEDDSITVEKLYALDVIMSELGRFLKIEAGSLASNDIESMRIVSSLIEATTYLIHNADGDVSVRLDGVDNYIAGRIHAGMTESTGISIDYGPKTINTSSDGEGEDAGSRTFNTAYLDFNTADAYRNHPSIFVDRETGALTIRPGELTSTDPFRSKFNILGDVRANRLEPRSGLHISSDDATGGMITTEDRTRVRGRMSDEPFGGDMILHGRSSSSQTVGPSFSAFRHSFTYWTPAPSGVRSPQVTPHVGSAYYDSYRVVATSAYNLTASGFNTVTRYIGGSTDGNTTFWIDWLAVWR